jgi:hypothetical protein
MFCASPMTHESFTGGLSESLFISRKTSNGGTQHVVKTPGFRNQYLNNLIIAILI